MSRIEWLYCECCRAVWQQRGCVEKPKVSLMSEPEVRGVHGFSCRCDQLRYCSVCMHCEDHCQCGEEQDLQRNILFALFERAAKTCQEKESVEKPSVSLISEPEVRGDEKIVRVQL